MRTTHGGMGMKFKLIMLLAVLLLSFGMSQAQTEDSVFIELYNATDDVVVAPGSNISAVDTLGNYYQYQVRMYIENSFDVFGGSLGFEYWGDAGLKINWEAQTGGWGNAGEDGGCACVTIPIGSRFDPAAGTGSWSMTGLLVTEQDLDSIAPDTILVGGVSLFNSLATGPKENMFNFHFTMDIPDVNPRTLRIDSVKIGTSGDFVFVTDIGMNVTPNMDAAISYTVTQTPLDADSDGPAVPLTYGLDQNMPNPFNPSTTLAYSVARKGMVNITVFNILGQNVKTLLSEDVAPGNYEVVWDGNDNSGAQVASGIYFYKMVTKDFVETKKMVLMR